MLRFAQHDACQVVGAWQRPDEAGVTSEVITTRADLLDRIRGAHDDLTDAIAVISDKDITRPNTIGTWSIRDVIAHIGGDEMWMAGQLEALRFGTLPTVASCYGIDTTTPPDMDWNSQDARNDWQSKRLRNLSLDDVRGMTSEGHARLLAVIASLDDTQLAEPLAIGGLGTVGHLRAPNDGEQAWPLWEWLRGVTHQHYGDHTNAIRTAGGHLERTAGER